jgi:SAM-dependent methyltransferase
MSLPGLGSVPEDRYGYADRIGGPAGLAGAGPLAVMTADQLHPMMVNSDEMWSFGQRWHEASVAHVNQAAELCAFEDGHLVLDIGSGLGGPARVLAGDYGVRVIEMNLVRQHLDTSRELWGRANRSGCHVRGDATALPFADATFDAVWSMNMAYHVQAKGKFLDEVVRVLKPGAVFMLDDWMLTSFASTSDEHTMCEHFGSGALFRVDNLMMELWRRRLCAQRLLDVGLVGRSLMSRYVREVVERDFLGEMERLDPEWGKQTGLDFIDSIEHTVGLYESGAMTYVQLAARKLG